MNRNEFKANAMKGIDNIFAKIDELEAKKDNAKAETKAKYEEHLAALKVQRENLMDKYNDLSEASDEKWAEAKGAFSSAAESFKEGFDKIKSIF